MITLEEANKIMQVVNKSYDIINNKMREMDTDRMHNRGAHYVYDGLRFAHIEMCNLLSDMEKVVLNEELEKEDN